jgi:3',5'-cyclic AMP phosphodiesterase CpdA
MFKLAILVAILGQANSAAIQESLRVSFFGDSGSGSNTKSVLQIVKESDLAIQLGDYDYRDDPALFEKDIQSVLGANFPFVAAIGNHDVSAWNGYQPRLEAQLNRSKYKNNCSGEYGINFSCRIGDVHIILSGVGTKGSNHVSYIDNQFSSSDAKWKICVWHKNQRDFQVGGKSNEVGWEAFEKCREHGAMIMMGHEHSYARSKVMSSFTNKKIYSNDKSTMTIGNGHTFSVVAGLGGKEIRDYESNLQMNTWWSKTGASNDGIKFGAVVCDFFSDRVDCAFKQVGGKNWDTFTVVKD